MGLSPAPQGGARRPEGSGHKASWEGRGGEGHVGETRSGSEAEPRAGLAAWKVISQLEAGEFCLAPSTSEMVPEKKLLLAFVTANFRRAPCAPVSPEFQLAKLVGIKVNLNLQVDGGGAGAGEVAGQEDRAGVGKWVG